MAAKAWDHRYHMPELRGRVAFVTGGNAGIGYQCVRFLAKAGAKVYFGARSIEKAEAALEKLYEENPTIKEGQVNWVQMDMASMKSVLKGSEEILKKESKLHLLINNAAHEGTEPTKLADSGVQITMQTNHVGVFALTQQFQPLLRAAAKEKDSDVRIIMVSSDTAQFSHAEDFKFEFADAHGGDLKYPSGEGNGFFDRMRRYAISKLAINIQASELQARYDREGIPIMVVAVCPGTVWTPGTRRAIPWYLYHIWYLRAYSEEMGPRSILFAGTSRECRFAERYYKGQFINRSHLVIRGHVAGHNPELGRELWAATQQIVDEFKQANP
ncbi:NAD(P)-binding protein [Xylaria arbuscula]|nr:NAD(P)-binding protein [Xylaria arbuscula]